MCHECHCNCDCTRGTGSRRSRMRRPVCCCGPPFCSPRCNSISFSTQRSDYAPLQYFHFATNECYGKRTLTHRTESVPTIGRASCPRPARSRPTCRLPATARVDVRSARASIRPRIVAAASGTFERRDGRGRDQASWPDHCDRSSHSCRCRDRLARRRYYDAQESAARSDGCARRGRQHACRLP